MSHIKFIGTTLFLMISLVMIGSTSAQANMSSDSVTAVATALPAEHSSVREHVVRL